MASSPFSQSASSFGASARLEHLLGRLNPHRRAIMLAGVGFQIVVLLAMIVTPLTTVLTGDTLLVRVVPVDPRDLLRGDYVMLNYRFSRIPPGSIPGLSYSSDGQGRTVYVTLIRDTDGKHWRADRYSLEKPAHGKFLRGRLMKWNRLEFGIESFFVQEDEGRKFEQAARQGRLSAEIAVDQEGKAVLKRLVITAP